MQAPRRMHLEIEALEPRLLLNATVTDANILAVISTDLGTPGVAGIGDVVTTTWDNSAGGDNNTALVDGVYVDLSQLGGPSNQPMYDDGTNGDATSGDNVYTYAWTVTPGNVDDTNLNVSVTASDAAGAGHDADTSNLSVDSIAPNVTDGNIATTIYYDGYVTGVANIGDTIRVTWNNSAGGDNSTGINNDFVGATADFSQFGGPAAVTMVDNGTGLDDYAGDGIYTASWYVTADSVDATDLNASVTATDDAGNTTTTADTSNLSVDNIAPTVTDENIDVILAWDNRTIGVADINDGIKITWDNSAAGDNNADALSSVTVNLSSIGGPSDRMMYDDGTHGDDVGGDGIYTAIYKIRAGNVDFSVENVSVTVVDDAGNSTTAYDTSDLVYDNAPVATFASGGTLVSIYDVKGPVDISGNDIAVKFEKTGDINSIKLLNPNMGEGLGITIAGAEKIESIKDLRKGDLLADMSFIASGAFINSLKLNSGICGYDLNGLNLDGLYFANDIDGDGCTRDDQAIWGDSGLGKASILGNVKGDIFLDGGGVVLKSLRIAYGDYRGDMTLWGDAGTISIVGGDLRRGNTDVYGILSKLIIAAKKGVGGTLEAGAVVSAEYLRSGQITQYETDNGGNTFGFDLGGLGKLKLDGFTLKQGDTPFFDGDFVVSA